MSNPTRVRAPGIKNPVPVTGVDGHMVSVRIPASGELAASSMTFHYRSVEVITQGDIALPTDDFCLNDAEVALLIAALALFASSDDPKITVNNDLAEVFNRLCRHQLKTSREPAL